MPDTQGTTWTDEHFIGGHVALDFANTVYRRVPERGAELLDAPGAFDRWLTAVEVLPDGAGRVSEAHLVDAMSLRDALWTMFDAQGEGRGADPVALGEILAVAAAGAAHVHVDERGAVTALHPSGATAAIALAALQLLLHPPVPPVRACDGCGWFFIDTSRGRRRRWCSMKTCGNDHKVARFRASHGKGTT